MPSVGLLGGATVFADEISDSIDVLCPECGQPMYIQGGPQTNCRRHFAHYPETSISSGESEEHQRWKELTFRAFSNLELPHQESLFFCIEGVVDVSNTPSDTETRRADVLLRFGDGHDKFGEGIAIEIQHRHTDKNVHQVTYDYLANGFSVCWTSKHDFTDNKFDAADVIAESDTQQMFFRKGATKLPDFDEFCQLDFADLADLLDDTQLQLSRYTDTTEYSN